MFCILREVTVLRKKTKNIYFMKNAELLEQLNYFAY